MFTQLTAQNKLLVEELRLLKEAAQYQTEQQSQQFRLLQEQYKSDVCEECKVCITKSKSRLGTEKDTPSESTEVVPSAPKDWLLLVRDSIWAMATKDTKRSTTSVSVESLLANVRQYIASNNDPGSKGTTQVENTATPDATAIADFAPACDLLLMYLNNVVKNPTVPRYRRISTTNNSYMKTLSVVQGHEAVLATVGFVRKAESNHFEYEWHSLCNTAGTAGAKGAKLDRPDSAQEAAALLVQAVALLSALKTSVLRLATELQDQLISPDVSSTVEDTHASGATDKVLQHEPANNVGIALPPICGIKAPLPVDDSLVSVSVVEVSEHDNLSGGDEAAAAVDFMQVCCSYIVPVLLHYCISPPLSADTEESAGIQEQSRLSCHSAFCTVMFITDNFSNDFRCFYAITLQEQKRLVDSK